MPDDLTTGTDKASKHFQASAASDWHDSCDALYWFGVSCSVWMLSGLLSNAWVLLVLVCGCDTDNIGAAAGYIRCLSCVVVIVVVVYLVQFILAFRSLDDDCDSNRTYKKIETIVTYLWVWGGLVVAFLCCLGCWLVIDDDDDDEDAEVAYVNVSQ